MARVDVVAGKANQASEPPRRCTALSVACKSDFQHRRSAPLVLARPSPSTTAIQITFAWEPPIIDGGAHVFEHEISYSVKEVVQKDKYSKQEDVVTPAEPVLTSR